MVIRLLKGYAKKSVLMQVLYNGVDSDKKLIIDCVGVPQMFPKTNILTLNVGDKIEHVLDEVEQHGFKHVFIYANASEEEAMELVETLRKYEESFTSLVTVQMDESYRSKFEILEFQ